MSKSVTIRAAWIGAAAVIVAALIYGLFMWLSPRTPHGAATVSGNQNQGPLTVAGTARDITINYNVPATETKQAIDALEKKLESTNASIELTRNEVKLLTRALTDLDQRTSGITKLPDGRTAMGGFIAGEPHIVIQEHEVAVQAFQKKNYPAAFEHSKAAISAYEDTAKIPKAASTGDLAPDAIAKLYYLGAILAATNKQLETALTWIRKADSTTPKPEYKAYEVAVLSDLGKREDARSLLETALKEAPNDSLLLNVKQQTGL